MKFLAKLKPKFIELLKGQSVKLVLKKLLGSAMAGGFRAWIIKFIVTELFEEFAEPLIKLAFLEMGYVYEKTRGKILVKKLEEAQSEGSQADYDDVVDDIMG